MVNNSAMVTVRLRQDVKAYGRKGRLSAQEASIIITG